MVLRIQGVDFKGNDVVGNVVVTIVADVVDNAALFSDEVVGVVLVPNFEKTVRGVFQDDAFVFENVDGVTHFTDVERVVGCHMVGDFGLVALRMQLVRIFVLDGVEVTRPGYGYSNLTKEFNESKSTGKTNAFNRIKQNGTYQPFSWWTRSPYNSDKSAYSSIVGHVCG